LLPKLLLLPQKLKSNHRGGKDTTSLKKSNFHIVQNTQHLMTWLLLAMRVSAPLSAEYLWGASLCPLPLLEISMEVVEGALQVSREKHMKDMQTKLDGAQ
jgi:hypothetical protein